MDLCMCKCVCVGVCMCVGVVVCMCVGVGVCMCMGDGLESRLGRPLYRVETRVEALIIIHMPTEELVHVYNKIL